jgi:deoxyribose-phosphate aldolase
MEQKTIKNMYTNKNKFNNLNRVIDYTYLKPDSNVDRIKQICNESKEFNFYSVCIYPDYVSDAKNFLDGSNTLICTVISFPDGKDKTIKKLKETENAIINGADEIDMVMNYKLLKKINDNSTNNNKIIKELSDDINKISQLCHGIHSVTLKVIIESGVLTYEQTKIACEICTNSGADFVKTSTGFAKISAEIDKVKYMRKILPDFVKIKASGGIRTMDDIEKYINAGADRIGTSSNPFLYS